MPHYPAVPWAWLAAEARSEKMREAWAAGDRARQGRERQGREEKEAVWGIGVKGEEEEREVREEGVRGGGRFKGWQRDQ